MAGDLFDRLPGPGLASGQSHVVGYPIDVRIEGHMQDGRRDPSPKAKVRGVLTDHPPGKKGQPFAHRSAPRTDRGREKLEVAWRRFVEGMLAVRGSPPERSRQRVQPLAKIGWLKREPPALFQKDLLEPYRIVLIDLSQSQEKESHLIRPDPPMFPRGEDRAPTVLRESFHKTPGVFAEPLQEPRQVPPYR
jgi:hypothetical protein